MKKTLLGLAAFILLLTSGSNIMAASVQSLPEAVSRDPYDGRGSREQYLALAERYQAQSLRYEASYHDCMESIARSTQYSMQRASSAVSNMRHGGHGGYGYGGTYSQILRERSSQIEYRARAKEYRQMARQAKAEQRRYLELARRATR